MKSFDNHVVPSLSNHSYRYFLSHSISSPTLNLSFLLLSFLFLPLFSVLFSSSAHPSPLHSLSSIPCVCQRGLLKSTRLSYLGWRMRYSILTSLHGYSIVLPSYLPSFLNLIYSRKLHLILVIASHICYFIIPLFFASSFFSSLPPLLFLSLCTNLYHYFNIHFLSFFVLLTVDSEGLSYCNTRDSDHQFYS